MSLLNLVRSKISTQNPLLLFYHKILGVLAAVFYNFPSRNLKVIAVTGTKGKSTTTQLLASILREAGHKVGVSSTINFRIGDRVWTNATKQTTQGRFALQKLLRQMVNEKCDIAVIEVTSHALVQSRIWGIYIDTAILTNIQRDHLEYHGGLEKYVAAKGLLFKNLPKISILPAEEPHFAYFHKFHADAKITYGLLKGDLRAENIKLSKESSNFTLVTESEKIDVHLGIPGEFNILNALAAAGAAFANNVSLEAIKQGFAAVNQIPGRLEVVVSGQPFTVVVDYAHTPDSLEKLLSFYRPLTRGKLWAVFGATGGGRDKAKRPEMGRVAAKYADNIVLTDDDPYTEDRMQIIEQVASGIPKKERQGLWKILGRREAMTVALKSAHDDDTVIIAGKGCETIQIVGEEKIPWDDREVVREILEKGHLLRSAEFRTPHT